MKDSYTKRIYAFAGLISWVVLALLVLSDYVFDAYNYAFDIPLYVKALLLNTFIVSVYLFIERKEEIKEEGDFYNILWSVFFIGLVCTGFSMLLTQAMKGLNAAHTEVTLLWLHLLYIIELGMLIVFLIIAFVRWKRLILYQNSRFLNILWRIFEFALFSSLFLHFFDSQQFPALFSQGLEIVFFVFSIFLSINLSWIAFLSLRQKAISLMLLIGIILFIIYFYNLLKEYPDIRTVSVNLPSSTFFASITIFVGTYSIFSILVMLFNMPTSSVFERKFAEISDFRKLIDGKTALQVYDTMLEIAIRNLKSDAAWLELNDGKTVICSQIAEDLVNQIRTCMEKSGYNHSSYKKFNPDALPTLPEDFEYRSILAVPLISNAKKHLATLVLLKREYNAFDNVVTNLISTYAAQASIALDNFRLISEAVESERFKTELMTAKQVQQRLLSKLAFKNDHMEILATSLSPEEVGGDFYDFFQISETKYALVLGDVSGKGTVAAFNMAQMKGVFHALVHLDLPPELFLKYANEALSRCLERNSFITLIYILIDTKFRKIEYVRAGHCLPLYLEGEKKTAKYMVSKGLGLGIMRNKNYKNYISTETLHFKSGDMLFLYTDGIVEAKSGKDKEEEFGYDNLKDFLTARQDLHLEQIADNLVHEIYNFTNHDRLQDDCTVLMIKFV